MTSFLEAQAAARERFRTEVAEDSGLVVFNDNDARRTPPAEAPWCEFSIRPVDSRQIELGRSFTVRDYWLAIADIRIPLAIGDRAAYVIADAIDAAMGNQSTGGVHYGDVRRDWRGRDNGWWRLVVEISFHSDRIKAA